MTEREGQGEAEAQRLGAGQDEDAERERRLHALRAMAWRELGMPEPEREPETRAQPGEAASGARPAAMGRQWPRRVLAPILLVALVAGGVVVASHSLTGKGASRQTAGEAKSPAVVCASAQPPYANIQVSHDGYKAHSEPMVAANPRNPLNLVGGTKFFTDPAHYQFQIGIFASFDGGCTWSDEGVLPGFVPDATTSDVSIAFDLQNDVYVAVLYAAKPGNEDFGYAESGIAVSTSHDGGKTFGAPVLVYLDTTGKVFSDKPWIVVDQTTGPHRGSVYVVWSYDNGGVCDGGGCKQDVAISRSTDGGRTFSAVQLVEGSAAFCTNAAPGRAADSHRCDAALGTVPVVEPNGTLVVVYAYEDLLNTGKIPTRLVAIASHDGGDTWTQPSLVATVRDIYGTFPPEHYRNATLPALACDPRSGQLYVAWSDKSSGDADVLLSTSHDDGETWSGPLRVNDDPRANGAEQFQPQLAVTSDGVVGVMFFDTRNDPQRGWIDVYLAQSTDHGASVTLPNIRVTTQSWDPAAGAPTDGNGLQFIGDYQGLAAAGTYFYPFWNDSRIGTQEIFTAAIPEATRS
jgi:hypothetical protein